MAKKNSTQKAEAPASAPAQPTAPAAGLPLFFRKPHPLDVKRHKQAAIRPGSEFSFARATNSIPLNAIEFLEAVRHYPIVFTMGDNPMPVAIVGLERANYFVQADNSWKPGAYIPAYVRQYPFVFFERPEEKKFYLCIDEGAPHFKSAPEEGALRLYKDDDKPSDITNNALQFCTAFYNHYLITRNFCEDLKNHKLLMPYQSEAKLASGKVMNLAGFQMINEKALNQLPDKVFLEFRRKGWLPFIYFMLASAANWKRLIDIAPQDA